MTASVPALIEGLYCVALRSAALFWSPKLGKIGIIYDDESQKDHEFAASLKKQQQLLGFTFDMMYQPLPSDPSLFTKLPHIQGKYAGYNRQLWNSFFMDEYVKTSVIAWTDTDVMFTTPVTPENIFNGGQDQNLRRNGEGKRLSKINVQCLREEHDWRVYVFSSLFVEGYSRKLQESYYQAYECKST